MSRFLHTMLRVGDLDRSVAFYTGALGMKGFWVMAAVSLSAVPVARSLARIR